MRTTHTRNMFDLRRPQIIQQAGSKAFALLIGLFICQSSVFGQFQQGNFNYLDFQAKQYYFGITLGYNRGDYRIYHSKEFIRNDSFTRAESVTGPGFNLGIVSNLK